MKASRLLAFAALAMLLPVAAASAQDAIKVGVCNPVKVLEQMDERKSLDERRLSEGQKAQAEGLRRKNEVEDLQRQRSELRPESAIYQEKTNQIVEKATQFEVWMRIKQNEMERTEKELLKMLYDKIRDACKEIAQEKKLDLILAERKPELPPNMETVKVEVIRNMLTASDVLYANEKADITQEVILRVNKKYAAGGGVAPVGANNTTGTPTGIAPQK